MVRAANAGEIEYAERGIYRTVKDMSEGIEPVLATSTLTDVGKKNFEKITKNAQRTLTNMKEGIYTDKGFVANKIIQNAIETTGSKVKPSEELLLQQKLLTESTISDVVSQKATNGIKTLAQMNNNYTTEELLRQALNLLSNTAKPVEDTAIALTKDVQESILNKVKSIKSGDATVSFNEIEEVHTARL